MYRTGPKPKNTSYDSTSSSLNLIISNSLLIVVYVHNRSKPKKVDLHNRELLNTTALCF